MALLFL